MPRGNHQRRPTPLRVTYFPRAIVDTTNYQPELIVATNHSSDKTQNRAQHKHIWWAGELTNSIRMVGLLPAINASLT